MESSPDFIDSPTDTPNAFVSQPASDLRVAVRGPQAEWAPRTTVLDRNLLMAEETFKSRPVEVDKILELR
jgi:hypothetical protein